MKNESGAQHCLRLLKATAVVFDIGDTLIDASGLMEHALRESAERLYREKLIEDTTRFMETYRRFDKSTHGSDVNHLFSDLRIIRRTWSELRLAYSPNSVGTFLGTYRECVRQGVKRDDELVNLFCHLKDHGLKIGVITDGSTIEQIEQLFLLGVVRYLDILVTSEDVGVEKPDRKMFQAAIDGLMTEAKDIVMVGDDVERDIIGAKRLGMSAVLVTRYGSKNITDSNITPDITLSDITELRKYV
jgi:putative hydrolase of the HAD superfamily